MDLYCPCAMCESNRRALRWDRPLTEARDVSTAEDIRRLMRERRVTSYGVKPLPAGATLRLVAP